MTWRRRRTWLVCNVNSTTTREMSMRKRKGTTVGALFIQLALWFVSCSSFVERVIRVKRFIPTCLCFRVSCLPFCVSFSSLISFSFCFLLCISSGRYARVVFVRLGLICCAPFCVCSQYVFFLLCFIISFASHRHLTLSWCGSARHVLIVLFTDVCFSPGWDCSAILCCPIGLSNMCSVFLSFIKLKNTFQPHTLDYNCISNLTNWRHNCI